MIPLTAELLERCARRVLEDAAFLFLEPGRAGETPLAASIELGPPVAAVLTLATTSEVAAQIVENMLGSAEGLDPAAGGAEALCELANIVGGALGRELCGSGEVCIVGLPWRGGAGEADVEVWLRLDDGGLLRVSVRRGASAAP